jgi:hypothetical protein
VGPTGDVDVVTKRKDPTSAGNRTAVVQPIASHRINRAIPSHNMSYKTSNCSVKSQSFSWLNMKVFLVRVIIPLYYDKTKEPGLFNGIALGYGLDGRGSGPGRDFEFFSSPPCPDRFWSPPSLMSNG